MNIRMYNQCQLNDATLSIGAICPPVCISGPPSFHWPSRDNSSSKPDMMPQRRKKKKEGERKGERRRRRQEPLKAAVVSSSSPLSFSSSPSQPLSAHIHTVTSFPLLALPQEALWRILQRLPLKDLCRLSACCTTLRIAAWPQVALSLAPLSSPTAPAQKCVGLQTVQAWLGHRPCAIRIRVPPLGCRCPIVMAPSCWEALVAGATCQPQLRCLSLYGLDAATHVAVCRALAHSPAIFIQHLDLGGRQHSLSAAAVGHNHHNEPPGRVPPEMDRVGVLADALRCCCSLESLSLDGSALGCWLGAVGLRALFKACAALPRLRLLQLGNNMLEDDQIAAALQGLAAPPALETLELRRNALGTKAARALAAFLAHAPAFRELDLTANTALDDAALCALMPLLSGQGSDLHVVKGAERGAWTTKNVAANAPPTGIGDVCGELRGYAAGAGTAASCSSQHGENDMDMQQRRHVLQRLVIRRCPYTSQGTIQKMKESASSV